MALNPLAEALQDFARAPGRFALTRNEPRALFDNLNAVLLLAAGRATKGISAKQAAGLRQAACFFVRVALLRPGADHATVLGLSAGFSRDQLREHYRLLIRLTHPDFQDEDNRWPDDAAARVNLAYESLLSGKAGASPREPEPRRPMVKAPTRATAQRPQAVRAPSTGLPAARWRIGLAGAMALVTASLLALLWQTPHDPSLTLRSGAVSATPEPPHPPDDTGYDAASSSFVLGTRDGVRVVTPEPKDRPAPAARPVTGRAGTAVADNRPRPTPDGTEPRVAQPSSAPIVEPAVGSTVPVEDMAVTSVLEPAAAGPRDESPTADMGAIQRVLTDLLHMLETGQSERLRRWTASQIRQEDAAAHFARAYGRTLAGAEVAGLGQARFDLREADGQPVVHGTVQIRLRESGRESTVLKDFRLRAHFRQQEGGPTLSRLEAE